MFPNAQKTRDEIFLGTPLVVKRSDFFRIGEHFPFLADIQFSRTRGTGFSQTFHCMLIVLGYQILKSFSLFGFQGSGCNTFAC